MNTNDTNKILFKDLSYRLNGIFFEVHNSKSRFLKEKQYADEVEKLLKREGVAYKREYVIDEISDITGNRVDFLIDDKIVIDIKAKKC